jgi:hypothetical protein
MEAQFPLIVSSIFHYIILDLHQKQVHLSKEQEI